MQKCGLCSLLSNLLRRAMCVGSRRGSGESYYQELAETNAPDVATMETTNSSIYIRLKPSSDTLTTTVVTTRKMSILEKERSLLEALIADDVVASQQLTTQRHLCTGRFLTMHKRRRKKLQTRSLLVDYAILDDVLHGQVQIMLDRVGNWRFNAFTLETVTGGRSLPVLCVHLFHWYGLFDHFNLDVVRVWKLFSLIEEGYHSTNPYHNSIHATDVTQAMHCFLQESKILQYLEPLEIMASLIGAVTHDLDHPGVNQPFLIATSNHLAALYENTSVLENHHWRSAIGCLLESGVAYDIQPIRPELEKQISSLILATDITRQQEFIGKFRQYSDTDTLDMRLADHRHFILQIALKCADISNPCRPWDISKKWSQKVCEEFFRQGDYERQLNLPVTSLCDRQSTSVPKIQTGFFKFVVTPLMDEWHRFLKSPLSHKMMYHLKYNQNQWEGRLQAELAEETRTEISDTELLEEELEENEEDEEENFVDISDSAEVLIPTIKVTARRSSLQVPAFGANRFERRHSMPIHPVPKIVLLPADLQLSRPQESIQESDENRFDNDSLSLLSSDSDSNHRARSSAGSTERERPLSAENLLPDLSITSMTDSVCAGKLNFVMQGGTHTPNFLTVQTSKHLIRQQTFPPLQPYIRARYMSSTAELGACPEALIESRSSSSNDSNIECCSESRGVLLNKKDSFKREQDYHVSEKASKFAKLTIVPGQKENLDPSMLRRSLARRRGSAPVTVALPSKPAESDMHVSIVMNTCDRMRRGSMPVDAIKMTSMDTGVQSDVINTTVLPPNNNNNSNNNINNNQRRSSVPSDTSNVISRNSFNGKRRNQKKILRRRSSGGAEIFSPMLSEAMEAGSSSGGNGSAWYRFKRDISRRSDKDTLLTRRRGSLPVEVLAVGLSGTLRH